MNTFEISGGEKLEGEIIPQGAKNECLQVLCAVLLTDQLITIKNIPIWEQIKARFVPVDGDWYHFGHFL